MQFENTINYEYVIYLIKIRNMVDTEKKVHNKMKTLLMEDNLKIWIRLEVTSNNKNSSHCMQLATSNKGYAYDL